MRTALIALSALEIFIFVAVLALYLIKIARSLRATTDALAKVTFGVRAIESQCRPIGPSVTTINAQLDQIAAELNELANLAEQAGQAGNGHP
jgi:uncharacterized protein YoxC